MSEPTPNLSPDLPEPQTGSASIPLGLVIVLVLLGYGGCQVIDKWNADFSGRVFGPYTTADEVASLAPSPEELFRQKGQSLYVSTCASCHGSGGTGSDQVPPLKASEWVTGNPDRIVAIAHYGLTGPITAAGVTMNAVMEPPASNMSDDNLAALISYIRGAWGNGAEKISAEDVAEAREAMQGQTTKWTAGTLRSKFPE